MANVTLKTKFILRNDTEANWQQVNPVLLKGEAGYCSDKKYLKFGDGVTAWNNLIKFNDRPLLLMDVAPELTDTEPYPLGTIWMNTSADPPEVYVMTLQKDKDKTWQQVITSGTLGNYGVMFLKDFVRAAAGKAGYVDKALIADKLSVARTLRLTGAVTGNASFDGSADVTIAAALHIEETDIPSLPLSKIRDAGTAASRNVGTAAGQVPLLDASGKLNTSVLPQLAIVDVVEAATDAEMLSKNVQKGDMCLRSDAPAGAYILAGDDPKVLANWKRIPVPANAVLSVNGKVGVVTLSTDDVAEGAGRLYYTPERVIAFLQDAANLFIMDGGNA